MNILDSTSRKFKNLTKNTFLGNYFCFRIHNCSKKAKDQKVSHLV